MKNISECTVAELMHKDVLLVREDEQLVDVIRRMGERRLSSAIVDKRDASDAYGIITRKDIIVEASEDIELISTLKVSDLTTKPAISIHPHVRADLAMRLMRVAGVRRLVVLDGEHLAGVISNSDIFDVIVRSLAPAKPQAQKPPAVPAPATRPR